MKSEITSHAQHLPCLIAEPQELNHPDSCEMIYARRVRLENNAVPRDTFGCHWRVVSRACEKHYRKVKSLPLAFLQHHSFIKPCMTPHGLRRSHGWLPIEPSCMIGGPLEGKIHQNSFENHHGMLCQDATCLNTLKVRLSAGKYDFCCVVSVFAQPIRKDDFPIYRGPRPRRRTPLVVSHRRTSV